MQKVRVTLSHAPAIFFLVFLISLCFMYAVFNAILTFKDNVRMSKNIDCKRNIRYTPYNIKLFFVQVVSERPSPCSTIRLFLCDRVSIFLHLWMSCSIHIQNYFPLLAIFLWVSFCICKSIQDKDTFHWQYLSCTALEMFRTIEKMDKYFMLCYQ